MTYFKIMLLMLIVQLLIREAEEKAEKWRERTIENSCALN